MKPNTIQMNGIELISTTSTQLFEYELKISQKAEPPTAKIKPSDKINNNLSLILDNFIKELDKNEKIDEKYKKYLKELIPKIKKLKNNPKNKEILNDIIKTYDKILEFCINDMKNSEKELRKNILQEDIDLYIGNYLIVGLEVMRKSFKIINKLVTKIEKLKKSEEMKKRVFNFIRELFNFTLDFKNLYKYLKENKKIDENFSKKYNESFSELNWEVVQLRKQFEVNEETLESKKIGALSK